LSKIIVLQPNNPALAQLLKAQGYHVVDHYEARHISAPVDAYLYATYHPAAFISYYDAVDETNSLVNEMDTLSYRPAGIILNISHLTAEQVVSTLERRFRRTSPLL
jgi:hypothetical protein